MRKMRGKVGLWIVAGVSLMALAGCQHPWAGESSGQKVVLWNGTDFTGWTRVLADPNADINDVWQVRDAASFKDIGVEIVELTGGIIPFGLFIFDNNILFFHNVH